MGVAVHTGNKYMELILLYLHRQSFFPFTGRLIELQRPRKPKANLKVQPLLL